MECPNCGFIVEGAESQVLASYDHVCYPRSVTRYTSTVSQKKKEKQPARENKIRTQRSPAPVSPPPPPNTATEHKKRDPLAALKNAAVALSKVPSLAVRLREAQDDDRVVLERHPQTGAHRRLCPPCREKHAIATAGKFRIPRSCRDGSPEVPRKKDDDEPPPAAQALSFAPGVLPSIFCENTDEQGFCGVTRRCQSCATNAKTENGKQKKVVRFTLDTKIRGDGQCWTELRYFLGLDLSFYEDDKSCVIDGEHSYRSNVTIREIAAAREYCGHGVDVLIIPQEDGDWHLAGVSEQGWGCPDGFVDLDVFLREAAENTNVAGVLGHESEQAHISSVVADPIGAVVAATEMYRYAIPNVPVPAPPVPSPLLPPLPLNPGKVPIPGPVAPIEDMPGPVGDYPPTLPFPLPGVPDNLEDMPMPVQPSPGDLPSLPLPDVHVPLHLVDWAQAGVDAVRDFLSGIHLDQALYAKIEYNLHLLMAFFRPGMKLVEILGNLAGHIASGAPFVHSALRIFFLLNQHRNDRHENSLGYTTSATIADVVNPVNFENVALRAALNQNVVAPMARRRFGLDSLHDRAIKMYNEAPRDSPRALGIIQDQAERMVANADGHYLHLPADTPQHVFHAFATSFPNFRVSRANYSHQHGAAATARFAMVSIAVATMTLRGSPVHCIGATADQVSLIPNVVHNCRPVLSGRDYYRHHLKPSEAQLRHANVVACPHKFEDCNVGHPDATLFAPLSAHDISFSDFVFGMARRNAHTALVVLNLPVPLLDRRLTSYTDDVLGLRYTVRGDSIEVLHINGSSAGYTHNLAALISWLTPRVSFPGYHVQCETLQRVGSCYLLEVNLAPGVQEVSPQAWSLSADPFLLLPVLKIHWRRARQEFFQVPASRFRAFVSFIAGLHPTDATFSNIVSKLRGLLGEVRIGEHIIEARWDLSIDEFFSVVGHAINAVAQQTHNYQECVTRLFAVEARHRSRHSRSFVTRLSRYASDIMSAQINRAKDSLERDFWDKTLDWLFLRKADSDSYYNLYVDRRLWEFEFADSRMLPSEISIAALKFAGQCAMRAGLFAATLPVKTVLAAAATPIRHPHLRPAPAAPVVLRQQLAAAIRPRVPVIAAVVQPPLAEQVVVAEPDAQPVIQEAADQVQEVAVDEPMVDAVDIEAAFAELLVGYAARNLDEAPDALAVPEAAVFIEPPDLLQVHDAPQPEIEVDPPPGVLAEIGLFPDHDQAMPIAMQGELQHVFTVANSGDFIGRFTPAPMVQMIAAWPAPANRSNCAEAFYALCPDGIAFDRVLRAFDLPAPDAGLCHLIDRVHEDRFEQYSTTLPDRFVVDATAQGELRDLLLAFSRHASWRQQPAAPLLTLSGVPSSAKSHVIRDWCVSRAKLDVLVVVPSNKLARDWRRLADPRFTITTQHRTPRDGQRVRMIVIDEAYSIDAQTLALWARIATRRRAPLICVGDPYQRIAENGAMLDVDDPFYSRRRFRLLVANCMSVTTTHAFAQLMPLPDRNLVQTRSELEGAIIHVATQNPDVRIACDLGIRAHPHSPYGQAFNAITAGEAQVMRCRVAAFYAGTCNRSREWLLRHPAAFGIAISRATRLTIIIGSADVRTLMYPGVHWAPLQVVDGFRARPAFTFDSVYRFRGSNVETRSAIARSTLDVPSGQVETLINLSEALPDDFMHDPPELHSPVTMAELQEFIYGHSGFDLLKDHSHAVDFIAPRPKRLYSLTAPTSLVTRSDVRSNFIDAHKMADVQVSSSDFESLRNFMLRNLTPAQSRFIRQDDVIACADTILRFQSAFYANGNFQSDRDVVADWVNKRAVGFIKRCDEAFGSTKATTTFSSFLKTQAKVKPTAGFAGALNYGQQVISHQPEYAARMARAQSIAFSNLQARMRRGAIIDCGFSDRELSRLLRALDADFSTNCQLDVSRQDSNHNAALVLAFCWFLESLGVSHDDVEIYIAMRSSYAIKSLKPHQHSGAVSWALPSGDPFTLLANCFMMLCVLADRYTFGSLHNCLFIQKGDDFLGDKYLVARPAHEVYFNHIKLKRVDQALAYHAGRFFVNGHFIADPVRVLCRHFARLEDPTVPIDELYKSFIDRETSVSSGEVPLITAALCAMYDHLRPGDVDLTIRALHALRDRDFFFRTSTSPQNFERILSTQTDCASSIARAVGIRDWKRAKGLTAPALHAYFRARGVAAMCHDSNFGHVILPNVVFIGPTHATLLWNAKTGYDFNFSEISRFLPCPKLQSPSGFAKGQCGPRSIFGTTSASIAPLKKDKIASLPQSHASSLCRSLPSQSLVAPCSQPMLQSRQISRPLWRPPGLSSLVDRVSDPKSNVTRSICQDSSPTCATWAGPQSPFPHSSSITAGMPTLALIPQT